MMDSRQIKGIVECYSRATITAWARADELTPSRSVIDREMVRHYRRMAALYLDRVQYWERQV